MSDTKNVIEIVSLNDDKNKFGIKIIKVIQWINIIS